MSDMTVGPVPEQDTDVDTSSGESTSIYEALRTELSADPTSEPIVLIVPLRPKFSLRFRTDLEYDLLEAFTKRATNSKGVLNPLKLAYTIIAWANTGIFLNGQEAFDKEGTSLTFAHNEFRKMLGADSTQEAIKRLYGSDGHVLNTSDRISVAAGYEELDLESGENPLSEGS